MGGNIEVLEGCAKMLDDIASELNDERLYAVSEALRSVAAKLGDAWERE